VFCLVFDIVFLYLRLARLDRPIGWLLLLWPTLWAVWIAGHGAPAWPIVAVFMAGAIVTRAAGCVVNDYFDRDFDRHVERTRKRPLATGEISVRGALVFALCLGLLALALVLTLNPLAQWLAVAGALIAVTYPLFKRFTHFPQLYLGLAFSWGIPMAFAAQQDTVPSLAWILFLANLLWTVAYDTMYAMADRPDDIKIGVKSTAIWFGQYDRSANLLCQALSLMVLYLLGRHLEFNGIFNLGLSMAAGTAVYQYWLCRQRDRADCFRAFCNNNWFGGAIFAGIVLSYAMG
jgi:4-hydroxybenzoate polyprenyltransferase